MHPFENAFYVIACHKLTRMDSEEWFHVFLPSYAEGLGKWRLGVCYFRRPSRGQLPNRENPPRGTAWQGRCQDLGQFHAEAFQNGNDFPWFENRDLAHVQLMVTVCVPTNWASVMPGMDF